MHVVRRHTASALTYRAASYFLGGSERTWEIPTCATGADDVGRTLCHVKACACSAIPRRSRSVVAAMSQSPCEWAEPNGIIRSGRQRQGAALSLVPPKENALDLLLLRLRVHGLHYAPEARDASEWRAACPLCGVNGLILRESASRRLSLRCVSGCEPERVVAFLKCEPSDVVIAHRDLLIDELRELARGAIALARNLAKQVSVLEATIDRAIEGTSE